MQRALHYIQSFVASGFQGYFLPISTRHVDPLKAIISQQTNPVLFRHARSEFFLPFCLAYSSTPFNRPTQVATTPSFFCDKYDATTFIV